MDYALAGQLLLLLTLANGAPILARLLFGQRYQWPVDGSRCFPDGRPLLGPSKTWRGIVAAIVLTPPAALLLGIPFSAGLLLGAGAMAGDVLSSFIKRRLNIRSSGMALGLDQIPEALLPLLLVQQQLRLHDAELIQLTLAFMALELVLSRIFYHLHIRKQPY